MTGAAFEYCSLRGLEAACAKTSQRHASVDILPQKLPRVAVCLSGWLNVLIPGRGASHQRHLVSPLGADLLVAGSYVPSNWRDPMGPDLGKDIDQRPPDCADGGWACLLSRMSACQPKVLDVQPMLTRANLSTLLAAAPTFSAVKAKYTELGGMRVLFNGVSLYSPVLGTPQLSVLRELHSYQRCLALLSQEELARGAPYDRVVWSRLEYRWLAPHPPLELLSEDRVWAPHMVYGPFGVDDSHAVLSRPAADIYLGRWQLLFTTDLLQHFDPNFLATAVPEVFLDRALSLHNLSLGSFAPTMALACCLEGQRCNLGYCHMQPLFGCTAVHPPSPLSAVLGSTVRTVYGKRSTVRTIYGKRVTELQQATEHASLLACPGTRYVLLRSGVVGLEVPGPANAKVHVVSLLMRGGSFSSSLVRLRPTAGTVAGVPEHCPRAKQTQVHERLGSTVVSAKGFCAETGGDHVGDCEESSSGEWQAMFNSKHGIQSLADCIDRCRVCARCRFVSISFAAQHKSCMWFHTCSTFPDNLNRVDTAPDMMTIDVGRLPL